MDHNTIWNNHWSKYIIDNESYLQSDVEIKEYHTDLKNIIDKYKDKNKVIEVGCGTGITSLLLDNHFEKTLLDINPDSIKLAKSIFNKYDKKADFLLCDMFTMDIEDECFDIVFNSGVIEHLNYEERVRAIKEYNRILKKDGIMIIAFPNHFNIFYRIGYLILNLFKKWPYPEEYKLYDLKKEIHENNLILESRITTSKNILTEYFGFNKILKYLFCLVYKIFNLEAGYLTVLIIRK